MRGGVVLALCASSNNGLTQNCLLQRFSVSPPPWNKEVGQICLRRPHLTSILHWILEGLSHDRKALQLLGLLRVFVCIKYRCGHGIYFDVEFPIVNRDALFLNNVCQHRDDAPCISTCSAGEIYTREDGIVIIDPEKCTGSRNCMGACPYEAIYFNADLNIA